jgi:hypothetical protein
MSTLKRSVRCRHPPKVCLRYELVSISDDKTHNLKLSLAFQDKGFGLLTLLKLGYGQGVNELACGSQAFIATLLFDPSMSALPIIPKQNSVSVGLFTH